MHSIKYKFSLNFRLTSSYYAKEPPKIINTNIIFSFIIFLLQFNKHFKVMISIFSPYFIRVLIRQILLFPMYYKNIIRSKKNLYYIIIHDDLKPLFLLLLMVSHLWNAFIYAVIFIILYDGMVNFFFYFSYQSKKKLICLCACTTSKSSGRTTKYKGENESTKPRFFFWIIKWKDCLLFFFFYLKMKVIFILDLFVLSFQVWI